MQRLATVLKRADLWAGLMFVAWGLFILIAGADYPLGRAGRIGPGYAPRLIGFILAGLGLFLALRSPWTQDGAETTVAWRPLILVVGAVLVFAALLERAGLIAAILASVAMATFAAPDNTWRTALALGLALAAFAWALFVKALVLPIPVFMP